MTKSFLLEGWGIVSKLRLKIYVSILDKYNEF
jgi:hypothetical protein